MRSSPIAGDPVTDSFDTSKLLDIDVQQFPRPASLVALHRRHWIQIAQARQTNPSNHSRHGRATATHQETDSSAGQPTMPQIDDPFVEALANPTHAARSRRTIPQPFGSFGTIPTQPLPSRPPAHANGFSGGGHRPPLLEHSFHQQGSTRRTTSRILVHVHLGSSVRSVRFEGFQIRRSRPDGQLFSMNNVLRHHN